MDSERKRYIPCAVALAVVGVLALMACGIAAVFGTGALVWITQRSVSNGEGEPVQSVWETSPQGASLQPGRGLVEIWTDGGWVRVEAEMPISAGQRLRTGALSGAALAFPDGSRAVLGANTDITVDQLDFQSEPHHVEMTQSQGESDHAVLSATQGSIRYVVNTPVGSGEALGTNFNVAVTPDQSARFSVEEGAVSVTALDQTVVVESGQVSTINPAEPPSEPAVRVSVEGAVTQIGETWVIAGQAFLIHEHTLIIGDPQVGDIVHVEGRELADGTHLADLILLLRPSPANRFSLTGEVQEIGADAWVIAEQTIEIRDTTEIDPALAVGDLARVEGVILENGAFEAVKILGVGDDTGLPFEFVGVIETIGAGFWTVSGVNIAISEDTAIDEGLSLGDIVRVQGRILEDGTWQARRIERALEGRQVFEITGHIESMNPWRVAGISFETRTWTDIDPGLEVGDLVHVEGEVQEDGTWVAFEIERIQPTPYPLIIIIGTVISIDPWVVSGIPLNVTPETIIQGEISPGMLVRVEIYLLPDGTWQVVRITALDDFIGIPGCMNLTATVVSFDGSRIQLLGWPELVLGEDVRVEGELHPNTIIVIQLCFNEDGSITIVQIIIILQPEIIVEPPVTGDKVTICHKPLKKKGGNTITVSRSALPAHLGHGDYIGPCSP